LVTGGAEFKALEREIKSTPLRPKRQSDQNL